MCLRCVFAVFRQKAFLRVRTLGIQRQGGFENTPKLIAFGDLAARQRRMEFRTSDKSFEGNRRYLW